MKYSLFLSDAKNVSATNRLLVFIVVVSCITTTVLSFAVYYTATNQRTIIIPAGMDSSASVSNNTIDVNYARHFAKYICGLAFTYSPASARGQFAELLLSYEPSAAAKAKTVFYDFAERIEAAKSTSAYFPQKVFFDPKAKTIELTGMRQQYIDSQKAEDVQKTYIIKYVFNNGKFQVSELYEKNDREVQTSTKGDVKR
ncbi:MAG: hypothetical protein CSYNP_04005 [Syntrophus sp. SKADARSKE-3]|nr:hypothetical protein [Syntrophus sp. SKADARSKE-3]